MYNCSLLFSRMNILDQNKCLIQSTLKSIPKSSSRHNIIDEKFFIENRGSAEEN